MVGANQALNGREVGAAALQLEVEHHDVDVALSTTGVLGQKRFHGETAPGDVYGRLGLRAPHRHAGVVLFMGGVTVQDQMNL